MGHPAGWGISVSPVSRVGDPSLRLKCGSVRDDANYGIRTCRLNWYHGTLVHMADDPKLLVERVQTGVRIEKRILKVLKGFAEYHDMTLGDVLESIVLHAFDGKTPFSPASLARIRELKKFYGLDLDSTASHRLKEIKAKSPRKRATGKKGEP